MYIYHLCVGAHRGQKRLLIPLELELQAVMSLPLWMFGTKLWSSVRTATALNH